MQTLEVTGKTVEEATQAAAKQLGADPSKITVTVLEQTKGLFGKSSVRIRAEMSGEAAAPEAAPAAAPAPEATPAPKAKDEAPKAKEERKPRGGRTPKAQAPAESESAPEPVAAAAETSAPAEETSVQATQEDAERMTTLVREILDVADLEVTAKAGGLSGKYVNIELDGRDAAFLVGKHGEVLNALQYLVNIIANQKFKSGIRATLDGNDYRHRREEALTKMAQKIADQVNKRGEEAVLDALPAFERRIVHKALSEISGITTYSEGEEPNRRVVIAPAD